MELTLVFIDLDTSSLVFTNVGAFDTAICSPSHFSIVIVSSVDGSRISSS